MHFKGKKLEYRKYVFSLKKKINNLKMESVRSLSDSEDNDLLGSSDSGFILQGITDDCMFTNEGIKYEGLKQTSRD